MNLAKYIDHTYLKADASFEKIKSLCLEAKKYGFKTVCIPPSYVSYAKELLEDSDVLICTVIGFPLGNNSTASKIFEAQDAVRMGADEIDMVLNIGRLKSRDLLYVEEEIKLVKEAIGNHVLKVIIETCLLTKEEKIDACKCIVNAKADFVKTSTGFSSYGATFEDVQLLKECVRDKAFIKAAGGVRTHKDFLHMISLGADRVGTSSGIALLEEKKHA